MNRFVPALVLTLGFCALPAAAAGPEAAEEDASAAIAVVERFSEALAAGDLETAGAELAVDVIVLESGGAERSAAEYLGGHARHDAEFLKDSERRLLHRTARRAGNLAWVASEGEIRAQHDGKPLVLLSTETMVLRREAAGWKIVHIHWSSRSGKP